MFLKEVTKDVRLSSNQHDEEVELPPNEQHERVNSVLIASTFLLMFDVMAFLFYWSTVLSNEIIVIHKASTTEKLVTKGNICIEYYRLLGQVMRKRDNVSCWLKKLCLAASPPYSHGNKCSVVGKKFLAFPCLA